MSSMMEVTITIPNWAQFQDQLQAIVYTIQILRDTLADNRPVHIYIRDWDLRIDLVPAPPK